jgi:hypothetical protein
MSFISSVKQRLRRDYLRRMHRQAVRGILQTVSVKRSVTPFIFLCIERMISNYLAVNAPDTPALPYAEYGTPDTINENPAVLHFIGFIRFVKKRYGKTCHGVIQCMAVANQRLGLPS